MSKKSFLNIPLTNWGEVLQHDYDIAILPWGAVEPHNYHLPYLTDCILTYEIAGDAAEAAYEKGVTCMVMSPVYFGSQNTGQWNKPFCVHTRSETQKYILTDIVASLHAQGLRKLVIINGHGGNTFKPYVRDLNMTYPDFKIIIVDWFTLEPTKDYFEESPDEHAGEQETSVMLHYHPDLVNMESAGDGSVGPVKISALNKKIGWAPRDWDEVSKDTGIGNPKKSTADKGKKYVEVVVRKITELLVDLKSAE
ncbi:MAG: creatininase family protein [Fermentimonas sp.]|nr:creatininase family protein [Fermentimonas sp.]